MVIRAVYENGVFRPTVPVMLPESCLVELTLREKTAEIPVTSAGSGGLANLAAIAGTHPENPDLPVDLAAEQDHYLYGATKRS